MKTMFFVLVLAIAFAGAAVAQSAPRPDPRDPTAPVPGATYRSAFEGYSAFADQDLSDWRKANEEVGAAGGHAGHRPGQGPGQPTSKPQPGKPESSGEPAEKSDQGPMQGHGGHK
jgi:opacity protein-like surface antigen